MSSSDKQPCPGWDERDYRLWSKLRSLTSYGLVAGDLSKRLVSLEEILLLIEKSAEERFEQQQGRPTNGLCRNGNHPYHRGRQIVEADGGIHGWLCGGAKLKWNMECPSCLSKVRGEREQIQVAVDSEPALCKDEWHEFPSKQSPDSAPS